MPLAYFFRPKFDLATEYMNSWLGMSMGDASMEGFGTVDSSGDQATKYSFFDKIQSYNPEIVVADGHGSPTALTGQGLEEVLRSCFNNEVLAGRVVCGLSCLTGQVLGPNSKDKGALAYIGFVNEFSWIVTPPYNPPADPAARSFQQIVRHIVKLACRHQKELIGLKDLYDSIAKEFDSWIQYYSVPPGSNDAYAQDILLSLKHDKTGVIVLGQEGRQYPGLPEIPVLLGPLFAGGVAALVSLL